MYGKSTEGVLTVCAKLQWGVELKGCIEDCIGKGVLRGYIARCIGVVLKGCATIERECYFERVCSILKGCTLLRGCIVLKHYEESLGIERVYSILRECVVPF